MDLGAYIGGGFENASDWDHDYMISAGEHAFMGDFDGGVYQARTALEEIVPMSQVFIIWTLKSVLWGGVRARAGGVSGPIRTEPGTYQETITVANGQKIGLIEHGPDGSGAVCTNFHAWAVLPS